MFVLGFDFSGPNSGFGARMVCDWVSETVEVFALNTEPCQEKHIGSKTFTFEEFKALFNSKNIVYGYAYIRDLLREEAKKLFDKEYYDFYMQFVTEPRGFGSYVQFATKVNPVEKFEAYIAENKADFDRRLAEQEKLRKEYK